MGLAPLARIIVRYGAGYLVLNGIVDGAYGKEIASDADLVALVQTVLGFLLMAGTEGFYVLAKKYGWKT